MKRDLRISSHPLLEVPSRKKVTFRFDNKDYHGFDGETVASALYANGLRIFSRSNKYHRPRGLFCLTGNCSHCLMRVDGIPNTRICREPVKSGMVVESQNAWPSLKYDILSLSTFFSPWLKPGFYYRYFKRPRWAYLIWENCLRKVAGIGKIANVNVPRPVRKTANPEIVVIGGGISGMQAALTAADSGKKVWLIEREKKLGGQSLWDIAEVQLDDSNVKRIDEIAHELSAKVLAHSKIKILFGATAISWHTEENTMIVTQPETYWEMQPSKTILATGTYETPFLFGNSDLPGIFLGTGLQQLMHRDFVKPGSQAVVVTESERGYRLAQQLKESGVDINAILDLRKTDQCGPEVQKFKQRSSSSKVICDVKIDRAIGRKEVRGIKFIKATDGEQTELSCDVIAVAGPRIPANELAFQKSAEGTFLLESEFKLTRKVSTKDEVTVDDEMFIVGGANGCREPNEKVYQGEIAGRLATQEADAV